MTERSRVLEESIDQQYSGRNKLLIYGVEKNSNEETGKLVLKFIKNDLEINLTEAAIDRTSYWGPKLKKKKKKKKKVRPIIAKFIRYYDRKEVFSKRKYLKRKDILITEKLTSFKMKIE